MGKHICPICDDKDGKGFAAGRGRWIKVAITSLIIDEDPQQNEEVALNTIPDVAAELAKTAAWWNAFLQPPNDDFMINQDEHSLDGLTPRLACNDERCRKRLRREIHNQLKNIREAHLEWIDSTIGLNNELIRPFTPIVVDKTQRTLDILGRRITLGKNGIPAQYASFFSGSNTKIIKSGRDAFAMPPRFDCLVAGKALTWKTTSFDFTKTTPAQVEWTAKSASGPVLQAVTGRLEFDGTLKLQVEFFGQTRDTIFDDIWFVVPWAKDVVKYSTGLGMQAGVCPESYRWHWDASNHHQDAVWLGDANIGAMLRFKGGNYQRRAIEGDMPRRPWRVPDSWGAGGMHIEKKDGETTLTAFSGPKTLQVPTDPRKRSERTLRSMHAA